MPFRLVGRIDGQLVRLLLPEGRCTLGSADDCQLRLRHATVSRLHAELLTDCDGVEVRDLGSSNGTYLDGSRIVSASPRPGATLGFGKVRLTLEEIAELDAELGLEFDREAMPEALGEPMTTTVGLRSVGGLLMDIVPMLVEKLESGADELQIATTAAAALFEHLPARSAKVRSLGAGESLLFTARREIETTPDMAVLEVVGGDLRLSIELPHRKLADTYAPVAKTIACLMRMASREAGVSVPPSRRRPPPLPDPPTVAPAVQRLYEAAVQVAAGDVGILVRGESGTGKEIFSRFVHDASTRADAAFVALNCAALPRDLLEAELFGIERGVATGVDQRPGKFEQADGGTLFLDEIADMSPETQAKILRVLQEGSVYRLGGSTARPARCRIVAATNRDIDTLRAEGRFREDLYFRIAAWEVELPPLRHRRADILNLSAHFLSKAAKMRGIHVTGITKAALEVLMRYRWPGNIRQLENEMARAALFLGDGEALDSSLLGASLLDPGEAAQGTLLEERLAHYERREIERALHNCGGVATTAAEELGIGRSTLYRRMKALGIGHGE